MLRKCFIILLIILIIVIIVFVSKGETVKFGSYWQMNREVKTPLEWIILNETENSYLLITKYSIDASIFAHNKDYTTWENSVVREFLNNNFYNHAFSEEEKERIILTTVTADKNPQHKNVNQGKDTKDYVFLLSITEAEKYFNLDKERIATSTNYAKMGANPEHWSGVAVSNFGATCWRLRTMGFDNYHSCSVRFNGSISYEGDILYSPHYAIRPCIWIQK